MTTSIEVVGRTMLPAIQELAGSVAGNGIKKIADTGLKIAERFPVSKVPGVGEILPGLFG